MSFEVERLDLPSADLERAFAETWMLHNHAGLNYFVNYGLGILVDLIGVVGTHDWLRPYETGPCWPVRTRDARVAATVVQWLGTNVGFGFLHEALGQAGYVIVRKDQVERRRAAAPSSPGSAAT